ncbi:MAG: hypothetical protein AAF598_02100 [Bacteroidota bacterium]
MKRIYCLFLFPLFLVACHSHPEASETLKSAQAKYLENLKAEEGTQLLLDELAQMSNGIQVQGRALSDAEQAFVQVANNLQKEFEGWKKNLTEVPGVEAPGHEGHDHSHGESELSDDQYLQLQESLSKAIALIQSKATVLMEEQQIPEIDTLEY